MARSKSQMGDYYKQKTKKWFIDHGYECDYTERIIQRCYKDKETGKLCRFFKKMDVFGSDGIAMNENEIIFWNSKAGGKNHIYEGLAEFEKFKFPDCVRRVIVFWTPKRIGDPDFFERADAPDVIMGSVNDIENHGEAIVEKISGSAKKTSVRVAGFIRKDQ